jgi:SAM-dependent methyltransferase
MSGSDNQARAERIAQLGYDFAAQPREAHDACNLCGTDDWVVITHVDRYGYPATTTSCRRCSLTMLNPQMTRDAYAAFYSGVYRPLVSAYHGRLIDARTIQDEQREYAAATADLLAPFLGDSKTLLDIGGSTGVVSTELSRRFGVRATVLDPAPDEIAEAGGAGLETLTGFVEDWEPAGRTFDVVGMFQTLDHLLDVQGALATVRSVLAPGGLFAADIVDFRAAYLRNWSVEAATKIDHPFSLTQTTIECYFRRAGLRPVRSSYSADHLHVLYLCRAAEPEPDALPTQAAVDRHFDEVRLVQNAPGPLRP